MTGRDPLANWCKPDNPYPSLYERGGDARLDALHPLIAAARELAQNVLNDPYYDGHARTVAHRIRDLTTPKEGTP